MDLSLRSAIFVCFFTSAFHLIHSADVPTISIYLMAISFLGLFCISFLADLIRSAQMKMFITNSLLMLSLPFLGITTSLLNDKSQVCGIYLTFTVFMFMIMANYKRHPFFILFYIFAAFVLSHVALIFDPNVTLSLEKSTPSFLVCALCLFFGFLIFYDKKLVFDRNEKTIRHMTVSFNHEVSTHIASLDISLSTLQSLYNTQTKNCFEIETILIRSKKVLRNISFVNTLLAR